MALDGVDPGNHRDDLAGIRAAQRDEVRVSQDRFVLGVREYRGAMACRITELVLDCRNPEVLADFWCQVLGFVVLQTEEDGSIEIGAADTDLDDPGLTLVLSPTTEPKQTKLRLHFDVNAVDRVQDEELQRLHELGARKADVGQTGEESWHVLADPEGNEFCLLRRTVKPAS